MKRWFSISVEHVLSFLFYFTSHIPPQTLTQGGWEIEQGDKSQWTTDKDNTLITCNTPTLVGGWERQSTRNEEKKTNKREKKQNKKKLMNYSLQCSNQFSIKQCMAS